MKLYSKNCTASEEIGASYWIRTSGLLLRRQLLYPAELKMQITSVMKQTQQEILPKRVMGIEPTCSAWKADILPLNYTRIYLVFSAVLRRLYYYTTSQNKCQYFFLKKSKKFLLFLRLRIYRVCIVKNNRHPAFIRMPVNFYFSIFTVISLPSSPTVI